MQASYSTTGGTHTGTVVDEDTSVDLSTLERYLSALNSPTSNSSDSRQHYQLTSTPCKEGVSFFPGQSSEESSVSPVLSRSSSPNSTTLSEMDFSLLSFSRSDAERDTDDPGIEQPRVIETQNENPSLPLSSNYITNQETQTSPPVASYKIMFDNIDKTVRPRQMRIDSQTKSLHYVQLYAVKDFSSLSDLPPSGERVLQVILPTNEDQKAIADNFSILVARIIVEHIPFFTEDFNNVLGLY